MKPKISIILPTNRINREVLPKIENIQRGIKLDTLDINIFPISGREFKHLIYDRVHGATHYLEPTLRSLKEQTFKDFELIISHKYPIDAIDIVKKYDIPMKLVAEKHSIWHDLGYKYGTLCNNINTGVIHSSGELLWRLDDLTFFEDDALEELYNLWTKGYYATSKGVRCIDFDETDNELSYIRIGANKFKAKSDGWRAEIKPLQPRLGRNMCWGFSSTMSIHDFLRVNGHDELFDGSVCGTDMELGNRVARVSAVERLPTEKYIFEIDDIPYKYMMRDDVTFRNLIGDYGIQANSWKPTERERRAYKRWHIREFGSIDDNWDKFMDVPYIDMNKEYELKRLGEVVWEN